MSAVNVVKHNFHVAEQVVLEKFSKKLKGMNDKERVELLAELEKFKNDLSKEAGEGSRVPSAENQGQANGSNQVDGNQNVDNPFGQICAGPAALAAPMIYKMMQMYTELIGLEQKQKVTSLEIQSDAAIGNSKALVAAAIAIGVATIIAGAIGIASVVIGKAVSGKQSTDETTNNKEIEGLDVDLKGLNSINDATPDGDTVLGNNPTGEQLKGLEETNPRINEITTGKYKMTQGEDGQMKPKTSEELDEYFNNPETKDAVAIIKANPKGRYTNFLEESRKNLDQKTQAYNAKASKLVGFSTSRSTTYNIFSGGVGALGQVSSGAGQYAKGGHDAAAALQQTTSQQAAGISQESGKRMGDDYQNAVKALDALRGIQESHSRG